MNGQTLTTTATNAVSHDNAIDLKHVALGFLAAFLLKKGIDVHAQITTISDFLNSDQAAGLLAAVVGIVSTIQHNIAAKKAQTTVLVTAPPVTTPPVTTGNGSTGGSTIAAQIAPAAPAAATAASAAAAAATKP